MRASSRRISSIKSFIDPRIRPGIAVLQDRPARGAIASTPVREPCGIAQPELAAEAAQGIDARGAGAHPQRTGAVQALQGLLFDRLYPHRGNVGGAYRFKERCRIGGIGLVAVDVGAHIFGRQQLHLNAQPHEVACPVMSRATGFHHHQLDFPVLKPALKLGSREPMGFDDMPVGIGHGQLKHALCQVNRDGSSIHFGLLSLKTSDPHPNEDQ